MNTQALRNEVRQIETRHSSAEAACAEIFQLIRTILSQIEGPVDPEFKRALRAELDRAYARTNPG
jgi:hypothetical protein